MAVFLLRHTLTACSESICYGDQDVELAASFEQEYAALTPLLPTIDSILSSPLSRCLLLAEKIAAEKNLTTQIESRLKEMSFGGWQGKNWNNIPRREIDAWAQDFIDYRGHGGESVTQLRARIAGVLEDTDSKSNTLMVTHAGVIRSALYLDSLMQKDKDERDLKVGYGELICLKSS